MAVAITSTHCTYPRRDGQVELTWLADYILRQIFPYWEIVILKILFSYFFFLFPAKDCSCFSLEIGAVEMKCQQPAQNDLNLWPISFLSSLTYFTKVSRSSNISYSSCQYAAAASTCLHRPIYSFVDASPRRCNVTANMFAAV